MDEGSKGNRIFLEKPANWICGFDGSEALRTDAPVDVNCSLPVGGDIEYWGQRYSIPGVITLEGKVYGDRSCLVADMALTVAVSVPCARCLEETPLDISRKFRYFYKPLPGSEPKEGEAGEYTVLVETLDTCIDITDQIWESLIVSLPEKVVCSEDCSGLCPFCGANRNREDCGCSEGPVDPRLEKLAGLRDAINETGENIPGKGGNQIGHTKKQDVS
ncbi:MAG TPA: DUF177 domain-containing protein [Synergistales bacterium]|jgi:uncharacterized protein|nr:DUF177 domain-containing protein [Synergistales bacterium]HRV70607.1 DUF177 domain-containing protein [Thermovirgaceae bacterium]